MTRNAAMTRETKETKIDIRLQLEGSGQSEIRIIAGIFRTSPEVYCLESMFCKIRKDCLFQLQAAVIASNGNFHNLPPLLNKLFAAGAPSAKKVSMILETATPSMAAVFLYTERSCPYGSGISNPATSRTE